VLVLARQGRRLDSPRDEKGRYLLQSKGGNATFGPSQRNTKLYILARLDRDGRAGLAARVRAGEVSARAAAIKVFKHDTSIRNSVSVAHK
jgi:hypothetical protein